jgi:hypothetical protein
LLLRLDGAHDALENRAFCVEAGVDFLIKWNPRQERNVSRALRQSLFEI